jgi:hypothetical protein
MQWQLCQCDPRVCIRFHISVMYMRVILYGYFCAANVVIKIKLLCLPISVKFFIYNLFYSLSIDKVILHQMVM